MAQKSTAPLGAKKNSRLTALIQFLDKGFFLIYNLVNNRHPAADRNPLGAFFFAFPAGCAVGGPNIMLQKATAVVNMFPPLVFAAGGVKLVIFHNVIVIADIFGDIDILRAGHAVPAFGTGDGG